MEVLLVLPFWGYEKIYCSLAEICYSLGGKGKYKEKQSERESDIQEACGQQGQLSWVIPQLVSQCILSRSTLSIPWTYSPICWSWHMQHFMENLLGWPKSLLGFFCKHLRKNPKELSGQPNITRDLNHELISSKISFIRISVGRPFSHMTKIWNNM